MEANAGRGQQKIVQSVETLRGLVNPLDNVKHMLLDRLSNKAKVKKNSRKRIEL